MRKLFVKIIIVVTLIALFSKFFLIPMNNGMWWDEAVYMTLGRSLLNGHYSMTPRTTVESFRAPMTSMVVSLLSWSPSFARFLISLISVASVAMTFIFTKNIYNREAALWASLFVSTNALFIFFTTKILSEAIAILFISLTLIFLLKWEKRNKRKDILLSGIFLGFAVITRYLTGAAIIAFVIVLLYKNIKERKGYAHLFLFLAGIAVASTPYIFFALINFGSLSAPIMENLGIYTGVPPISFYLEDIIVYFIPVIVISCIGIFFIAKKKMKETEKIMLIMLGIHLFMNLFGYKNEPRHILTFMPIIAALAGFGLINLAKKIKPKMMDIVTFLILFLCLFYTYNGLQEIYIDVNSPNSLIQGCTDLKELTTRNDVILSVSYPYVNYFSQRNAVSSLVSPELTMRMIQEYNITYVLLYRFEETNPEFYKDFFDINPDFVKVKTYPQWGDDEATTIFMYVPDAI